MGHKDREEGEEEGGHQKNKPEFPKVVTVPSPPGAVILHGLWAARPVQIPAPPRVGCTTSGKTLHYYPQVHHLLKSVANTNAYFVRGGGK